MNCKYITGQTLHILRVNIIDYFGLISKFPSSMIKFLTACSAWFGFLTPRNLLLFTKKVIRFSSLLHRQALVNSYEFVPPLFMLAMYLQHSYAIRPIENNFVPQYCRISTRQQTDYTALKGLARAQSIHLYR
jgi:hypothetical protein